MDETDVERVIRWCDESGVTLDEEIAVFEDEVTRLEAVRWPEWHTAQRVNPAISNHLAVLRAARLRRGKKN